jgi:hypothetical protein
MQKNVRLACKKNIIFLLSITFGPRRHFLRAGSPFLANGCSKSNMGLMVKTRFVARGFTQTFEVDYNKLLHPL